MRPRHHLTELQGRAQGLRDSRPRLDDLLDSGGNVADALILGRGITKGGRNRRIPMHKQLRAALVYRLCLHAYARW